VFREELGNGGESLHEDLGHFIPVEVTGRKNKCTDSRIHQGGALKVSVSDTVIFGKNDPPVQSRVSQPFFVFGGGMEMVVVDLHRDACLAQRRCNSILAERPIEEKNGGFRRPLR